MLADTTPVDFTIELIPLGIIIIIDNGNVSPNSNDRNL